MDSILKYDLSEVTDLNDLREYREQCRNGIQAMLTLVEKDGNREFTEEESSRLDFLNDGFEQSTRMVERREMASRVAAREFHERSGTAIVRDMQRRQREEGHEPADPVDSKPAAWRDQHGAEVRCYDRTNVSELSVRGRGERDAPDLGGLLLAALKPQRATELERRQLSGLTDAKGKASIPIVTLRESIPALTQASTLLAAGARVIPLDTSTTVLASVVTNPTPVVRAEEGAVATSTPVLGRVELKPYSHACQFEVSDELLSDSLNIREMLARAAIDSMAQIIDFKGIQGTGSSDITGIVYDTNASEASGNTFAAPPTVAAPYGGPLNVLNALQTAGLRTEPTDCITTPLLAETWDGLQGTAEYQPVMPPASIGKLRRHITTAAEDVAPTPDYHYWITGDFSTCVLGLRMDTSIEFIKADSYVGNLLWDVLIHARFDWQRLQSAAIGFAEYEES